MKEYKSYFREDLDRMSGYTPGEQPKVPGLIKLNTNENPFPPSPEVMKALASADYRRLRLYPDPTADELRDALAATYGLKRENFIAGNGSDDILTISVRCFTGGNRKLACLTPSYSLYPTLAGLNGVEAIKISLNDDFSLPFDLEEQAAGANLLIIARPNAPTGNSFPKARMREICNRFNGIVMIDEAYADFAEDSCMDLVNEFANVIVSRTFSKSRSLAGLRLGFAAAHEKIIDGMMKMKDSYNVSRLTQLLAVASLKDTAYFNECCSKVKAARAELVSGLKGCNFTLVPSETNFVFAMPPDGDGEKYFNFLRENKILVRYFPGAVTGRYVRITVGTSGDVARLLAVTKELYS